MPVLSHDVKSDLRTGFCDHCEHDQFWHNALYNYDYCWACGSFCAEETPEPVCGDLL